jgi:hypothetical protein
LLIVCFGVDKKWIRSRDDMGHSDPDSGFDGASNYFDTRPLFR